MPRRRALKQPLAREEKKGVAQEKIVPVCPQPSHSAPCCLSASSDSHHASASSMMHNGKQNKQSTSEQKGADFQLHGSHTEMDPKAPRVAFLKMARFTVLHMSCSRRKKSRSNSSKTRSSAQASTDLHMQRDTQQSNTRTSHRRIY